VHFDAIFFTTQRLKWDGVMMQQGDERSVLAATDNLRKVTPKTLYRDIADSASLEFERASRRVKVTRVDQQEHDVAAFNYVIAPTPIHPTLLIVQRCAGVILMPLWRGQRI
jgi:hypothetical protein